MNYIVAVIKPLSVGRGQGPFILQDILDNNDLSLVKFRPWTICNTTWKALADISVDTDSSFIADPELVSSVDRKAWICLFREPEDIPSQIAWFRDYVGPNNPREWTKKHLRFRYSASNHASDNVVYLSPPGKEELVDQLLFQNFDPDNV